jgi:hypothetical protein
VALGLLMYRPIEIKGMKTPYVGRSNFTFFSTSLVIKNGSTAPDAFPTDTIVPLRFINLKLLSKLMELNVISSPEQAKEEYPRILSNAIKDGINTFIIR